MKTSFHFQYLSAVLTVGIQYLKEIANAHYATQNLHLLKILVPFRTRFFPALEMSRIPPETFHTGNLRILSPIG